MLQLEVIDIGREKEDCANDQRHLCIKIKKKTLQNLYLFRRSPSSQNKFWSTPHPHLLKKPNGPDCSVAAALVEIDQLGMCGGGAFLHGLVRLPIVLGDTRRRRPLEQPLRIQVSHESFSFQKEDPEGQSK